MAQALISFGSHEAFVNNSSEGVPHIWHWDCLINNGFLEKYYSHMQGISFQLYYANFSIDFSINKVPIVVDFHMTFSYVFFIKPPSFCSSFL